MSSVKNMDEYVKRKREVEEGGTEREEDIFKKSRMTERPPVREERMKNMFRELMEEMRGMKKEMKEQKEELREKIRKMKVEIQEREESWRRKEKS